MLERSYVCQLFKQPVVIEDQPLARETYLREFSTRLLSARLRDAGINEDPETMRVGVSDDVIGVLSNQCPVTLYGFDLGIACAPEPTAILMFIERASRRNDVPDGGLLSDVFFAGVVVLPVEVPEGFRNKRCEAEQRMLAWYIAALKKAP